MDNGTEPFQRECNWQLGDLIFLFNRGKRADISPDYSRLWHPQRQRRRRPLGDGEGGGVGIWASGLFTHSVKQNASAVLHTGFL